MHQHVSALRVAPYPTEKYFRGPLVPRARNTISHKSPQVHPCGSDVRRTGAVLACAKMRAHRVTIGDGNENTLTRKQVDAIDAALTARSCIENERDSDPGPDSH
jgi:hypothetical protein